MVALKIVPLFSRGEFGPPANTSLLTPLYSPSLPLIPHYISYLVRQPIPKTLSPIA